MVEIKIGGNMFIQSIHTYAFCTHTKSLFGFSKRWTCFQHIRLIFFSQNLESFKPTWTYFLTNTDQTRYPYSMNSAHSPHLLQLFFLLQSPQWFFPSAWRADGSRDLILCLYACLNYPIPLGWNGCIQVLTQEHYAAMLEDCYLFFVISTTLMTSSNIRHNSRGCAGCGVCALLEPGGHPHAAKWPPQGVIWPKRVWSL